MPKLTFYDLRKANVERCENSYKHSINDWSPADWALATTGELGELCNLLKKVKRGEKIDPEEIAKEFADTAIYLDLFAARCGVDLEKALRNKFNEVSDRVGSEVKL